VVVIVVAVVVDDTSRGTRTRNVYCCKFLWTLSARFTKTNTITIIFRPISTETIKAQPASKYCFFFLRDSNQLPVKLTSPVEVWQNEASQHHVESNLTQLLLKSFKSKYRNNSRIFCQRANEFSVWNCQKETAVVRLCQCTPSSIFMESQVMTPGLSLNAPVLKCHFVNKHNEP
jgi:hypothetical protein